MNGMSYKEKNLVSIDTSAPIWDHFFTVAPLIVIGTNENGEYNMAPKHMATPLGHDNYFGFVCTPQHSTYHNIDNTGYFTISYPKPEHIVLASLAASPRCEEADNKKLDLKGIPSFKAPNLDALFLDGSYLCMECEHMQTIDGFGHHSLITGKIISAFVDQSYLRLSDQDEQELIYRSPLLSYLAYGRFSEIKQSWAFPFPKNFKT